MGYSRVECRAGAFALLDTLPCPYPVGDSALSLPCGGLFLVPTLWGTLPCSLPCFGTDNQSENHLYVDCPGVGQVARGLRTKNAAPAPPSIPGCCGTRCARIAMERYVRHAASMAIDVAPILHSVHRPHEMY